MKDKQQSYFVNIGSSSLLVIFLILCLVTFAILSLSSAKSDYTFSERLAEHKRAYYEASARAEDIVGEIDSILYETSHEVGSAASSSHVDGELDLYDNYIFAVSSALNGAFLTGADSEDALTGEGGVSSGDALAGDGGVSVICEQSEDEFLISFQVPADERQELQVVLRVTDFRTSDRYYEVKTWKIVNVEDWEMEDEPLNLIPVL
ncbi:hypothetical protein D5282_10985 [bacterium 1xD8-48]|nr:hypothetical protein [bacterium 1xD8-48]